MITKRKLALPVIGLALVSIIGVVGGLAFSGGSSSSGDTSQPSPPASVAEPATRPPSETEALVEPDPDFQDALRRAGISPRGWTTDFSRHSVPYDEILSNGPPRDGIPPLDDSRFTTPKMPIGGLATKSRSSPSS